MSYLSIDDNNNQWLLGLQGYLLISMIFGKIIVSLNNLHYGTIYIFNLFEGEIAGDLGSDFVIECRVDEIIGYEIVVGFH
jgi:hypothetical protein